MRHLHCIHGCLSLVPTYFLSTIGHSGRTLELIGCPLHPRFTAHLQRHTSSQTLYMMMPASMSAPRPPQPHLPVSSTTLYSLPPPPHAARAYAPLASDTWLPSPGTHSLCVNNRTLWRISGVNWVPTPPAPFDPSSTPHPSIDPKEADAYLKKPAGDAAATPHGVQTPHPSRWTSVDPSLRCAPPVPLMRRAAR
jgi:hypothetical protein